MLLLAATAASAGGQATTLAGSWRGTSLCVDTVNYAACNNEQVIYDAVAKAGTRDTATLRADKIVNGARDFMGEFDFAFQADSTWAAEFRNPRVHVRLVLRVTGDHLDGTMTDVVANRRVREMSLDRVRAGPSTPR